ncbi:hypothetical protein FRC07_011334 [Ceratobasidium sp. 392]|nr:hypothetical protein FRC07_011334 [Ceratobasidium sp. 392]
MFIAPVKLYPSLHLSLADALADEQSRFAFLEPHSGRSVRLILYVTVLLGPLATDPILSDLKGIGSYRRVYPVAASMVLLAALISAAAGDMTGEGDNEDDVGLGVIGHQQDQGGSTLYFIQSASIVVLLIDAMVSISDESVQFVPLVCAAGLFGITITSNIISARTDREGVPLAFHRLPFRPVLWISYHGIDLVSLVVNGVYSFAGKVDPYQCGFLALFLLASAAMLVPKGTMSVEMRLLCLASYATAAAGEAMSADEDEDGDDVGSAVTVFVPLHEQVPLAVLQGNNAPTFYLILPGPDVLMLDGAEVMALWVAQVRATMEQI